MIMTYTKMLEYWIIVVGCVLAFISAFKPLAAIGYQLDTVVWVIGLLPYFVYSIAVVLMQSIVSALHGIALLAVHAWMVTNVRLIEAGDYSSDLLISGPFVLSLALFPMAIMALRRPYGQLRDTD